ncbi:MAG: FHA domain-containing protein [Pirellulaceae bacterium]
MMKIRLVSVCGEAKAAEISLQLPAIVGRGRGSALTVPHPLVSRRHCELYESLGKLMVRDLGSLNGTYVGSQRVTEAEIPTGELLTVATVNFRVMYGEATEEDQTVSPLLVGNDESTHGPGRVAAALAGRSAPAPDQPAATVPRPASGPVERDTEWQVGTTPPRNNPGEEDDLSSLLNGR